MNKKELIDFSIGLYQLTLLFPKKEPLRYKIREIADEILADFLRFDKINPLPKSFESSQPEIRRILPWQYSTAIEENLEILDSFLEIAKSQNWISPDEILKFQEKILKIKEVFFAKEEGVSDLASSEKPEKEGESLKFRQQKILEFLREKGKTQVGQLKKIFPGVSKRTLRRDFSQLVRQGLIERKGERNTTFYQLPTNYESKRITNY